jgi:hypothetical protein
MEYFIIIISQLTGSVPVTSSDGQESKNEEYEIVQSKAKRN